MESRRLIQNIFARQRDDDEDNVFTGPQLYSPTNLLLDQARTRENRDVRSLVRDSLERERIREGAEARMAGQLPPSRGFLGGDVISAPQPTGFVSEDGRIDFEQFEFLRRQRAAEARRSIVNLLPESLRKSLFGGPSVGPTPQRTIDESRLREVPEKRDTRAMLDEFREQTEATGEFDMEAAGEISRARRENLRELPARVAGTVQNVWTARSQIATDMRALAQERGLLGILYETLSKDNQDLYDQNLDSLLKQGADPIRASMIAVNQVTGQEQPDLTDAEQRALRNVKLFNATFSVLEMLDFSPIAATSRNIGTRTIGQLAKDSDPESVARQIDSLVPQLRGSGRTEDLAERVAEMTRPVDIARAIDTEVAQVSPTITSLNRLASETRQPEVSRETIVNLANRQDVKQAERDVLMRVLGDRQSVNVADFTNEVRAELLPLDTQTIDRASRPDFLRYETTPNLPPELRGDVANYGERIYQSPITTDAGNIHFGHIPEGVRDRYFAHTRIEDLPDQTTRRVIELQSDLFQRGRLDSEISNVNRFDAAIAREQQRIASFEDMVAQGRNIDQAEFAAARESLEQLTRDRAGELARNQSISTNLQPYRNTWWQRVVREEMKDAATAGKSRVLIPDGSTAMKVEGLGGSSARWGSEELGRRIEPSDLREGLTIQRIPDAENFTPDVMDKWVVSGVTDREGVFYAVPKRQWDVVQRAKKDGVIDGEFGEARDLLEAGEYNEYLASIREQFDISTTGDPNNPIHRFYERDLGKFLQNNYGAKKITDENGVTWWEVQTTRQMAQRPVEAFAGGMMGVEEGEDGELMLNPATAGLGVMGAFLGLSVARNARQVPEPPSRQAYALDDTGVEKTLMPVHNLSAENIRFANELGGLARPSIAITDVTKSPFSEFGEISLIARTDLIDPSTGLGSTFASDVYSPRFPETAYFFRDTKTRTQFDLQNDAVVKKYLGDKIDYSSSTHYQPRWTSRGPETLVEDPFERSGRDVGMLLRYMENQKIKPDIDLSADYITANTVASRLQDQLQTLGKSENYSAFVRNTMENAGVQRKHIGNRTASGAPTFREFTIENAIKLMGKKIKDGEGFNYGLGSVRSKVAPRFSSIEKIKKSKDRILTKSEFETVKTQMEQQFSDIAVSLADNVPGGGVDSWDASNALSDFIGSKGRQQWFYDTYRPDDQLLADIAQFADNLKAMPTEYFETKMKGAVSLNQFSRAIVPTNTPDDVLDILRQNNIETVTYRAGDEADRQRQMQMIARQNTGEAFAGGIVGLEEDEDGELTLNPVTAGIGVAAGFIGSRFMARGPRKKSDAQEQAEFEVFTEMLEFSKPGYRKFAQDGTVTGVSSSFPRWIPEHLRSMRLFEEVVPMVETGQRPANPRGSQAGYNRQELYDVVYDEILRREAGLNPESANSRALDDFLRNQPQYADPANTIYLPSVRGIKGKLPTFAPPKNIKAAIQRNLHPKSPWVRKREMTLLKNRIKAQQVGARKASVETRKDVKSVQSRLIQILDESNLSANDKAKFIKKVRNTQRVEQLEKAEPALRARIRDLIEADLRRKVRADISKTIKKAVPKSERGIPRGKLTAETQRELNTIREILKKDRVQGLVEASELAIQHQDNMTPEIARRIDYLRMSGIKDMSITELLYVDSQIQTLYETGRTVNELRQFNRAEQLTRLKEASLEALGGPVRGTEAVGVEQKRSITQALSTVDNWLHGIDTIMDKLSIYDPRSTGKFDGVLNTRIADAIHKARQNKNFGMRVWTDEIQTNFKRIFGAEKKRQLARIVNENKRPSVKLEFTTARGERVSRMLTPNQVYKKYMEMQDPSLRETFTEGMGWTQDAFDQINNYMNSNPRLKAWADWQLEQFYPSYGETVAPVYENRFNVPFPIRENYSPIVRRGMNTEDDSLSLLEDAYHRASMTPGSLRSRVANTNPLDFTDGDEVMIRHMLEMEHFKAFDEVVRDTRAVFSDPRIKDAIDTRFGRSGRQIVNRLIDEVARDGINTAEMVVGLDRLRANFTRSVLGVNPVVTLKQLASIPAFITEMPGGALTGTSQYLRYTAEFWKNPVKNARFLRENSEFMMARGRQMDRDIRTAMQSSTYQNMMAGKEAFKNRLLMNVQIGDQGAIFQGGYAVYRAHFDDLVRKGVPKDQAQRRAIEKFEAAARRTQQAGEPENLSVLQQTGGSIGKLFSMFLTAPNAYYRIASRSLRNLYYGRGSRVENARNAMIAWVVLPMTFQYISDGFQFREERQQRAAILGPLNGIPILGENIEDVVRAFTGDDVFSGSAPGPLTILGKISWTARRAIRDMQNADYDFDNTVELSQAFAEAAGNIFGYPVGQIMGMAEGTRDWLSGDGDVRRIIYSEYALDDGSGFTNDEKKLLPVYSEVVRLAREEDNEQAAQQLVDDLTDEEYEVYRNLTRKIRTRETEELKVEMRPVFRKVRQLVDEDKRDEAQQLVDDLSEREYRAYELVVAEEKRKEEARAGRKPIFPHGTSESSDSVIGTVWLYAQAMSMTPIQAFEAIFAGERIRRIDNRTVIVERMDWLGEGGSDEVKRRQFAEDDLGLSFAETRLDHFIPLQLGGLNTEDNLLLVPVDVHESWTPIENLLGRQLREGNISRKDARELITRFKRGEISASEIERMYPED